MSWEFNAPTYYEFDGKEDVMDFSNSDGYFVPLRKASSQRAFDLQIAPIETAKPAHDVEAQVQEAETMMVAPALERTRDVEAMGKEVVERRGNVEAGEKTGDFEAGHRTGVAEAGGRTGIVETMEKVAERRGNVEAGERTGVVGAGEGRGDFGAGEKTGVVKAMEKAVERRGNVEAGERTGDVEANERTRDVEAMGEQVEMRLAPVEDEDIERKGDVKERSSAPVSDAGSRIEEAKLMPESADETAEGRGVVLTQVDAITVSTPVEACVEKIVSYLVRAVERMDGIEEEVRAFEKVDVEMEEHGEARLEVTDCVAESFHLAEEKEKQSSRMMGGDVNEEVDMMMAMEEVEELVHAEVDMSEEASSMVEPVKANLEQSLMEETISALETTEDVEPEFAQEEETSEHEIFVEAADEPKVDMGVVQMPAAMLHSTTTPIKQKPAFAGYEEAMVLEDEYASSPPREEAKKLSPPRDYIVTAPNMASPVKVVKAELLTKLFELNGDESFVPSYVTMRMPSPEKEETDRPKPVEKINTLFRLEPANQSDSKIQQVKVVIDLSKQPQVAVRRPSQVGRPRQFYVAPVNTIAPLPAVALATKTAVVASITAAVPTVLAASVPDRREMHSNRARRMINQEPGAVAKTADPTASSSMFSEPPIRMPPAAVQPVAAALAATFKPVTAFASLTSKPTIAERTANLFKPTVNSLLTANTLVTDSPVIVSVTKPMVHRSSFSSLAANEVPAAHVIAPTKVAAPKVTARTVESSTPTFERIRTRESLMGRSMVPGYMTPTESSKVKARSKTPTPSRTAPYIPSSPTLKPSLTEPKTPHLATSNRRRSNSGQPLVSSSSRELQRLQEERRAMVEKRAKEQQMVQNVARARTPTNAFRHELTEPKPFVLRTDARFGPAVHQTVEYHSTAEITSHVLNRDSKAMPAYNSNASLMNRASNGSFNSLSEPQAPMLATDLRMRVSSFKSREETELEEIRKARLAAVERRRRDDEKRLNQASQPAVVYRSEAPQRPFTSIQPFELEGVLRHQRAQEEFRARVEQEHHDEEERRKFRARPVPSRIAERPAAVHFNLPVSALTQPVAPSCVERALITEEMRKMRLEREMKEAEKARIFKARPPPKTTYQLGFVPEPAAMALIEPIEPVLHSDVRAEQREKYEQARREQEAFDEGQHVAFEKEQKRHEEEEIREYRKSLVHHALPVPDSSKFGGAFRQHHVEEEFLNILPSSDPHAVDLYKSTVKRPFSLSSSQSNLGGGAVRMSAPPTPGSKFGGV